MYTLSGINTAGITGFAKGAYNGPGSYIYIESSGNSATVGVLASPNGSDRWLVVTSLNIGANATGTAVLSAFYPYLAAQTTSAYGGTNSSLVTVQIMTWQRGL